MANVISILIQAKDEASAVLSGVKEGVSRLAPSFEQSTAASRELALGLGVAGTSAAGLISYGAHVAGNLESWKQGFVTLLGSTEAASAALKMIQHDAASTPFQMTGLVQANMLLTGVTHNAGQSEQLLLNVGKALAAMGKGQPELDRVVVNLQQIGTIGHAQMVDLKQFAYDGIPIFDMLKKQTGLAGDALNSFIANGGVTFQMLTDMFQKAGTGSGQFANAFTAQAGTFNQLVSNMKDNFDIFAANLITKTGVFDILKNAVAGVVNFMTAHQDDMVRGIQQLLDFIQRNGPVVAGILIGALLPAFISLAAAALASAVALLPWAAAGAAVALAARLLIEHFGGLHATLAAILPVLQSVKDWFMSMPVAVQFIISPIATLIAHIGDLTGFASHLIATLGSLWQTFAQSTIIVIVGQYISQVLWPAIQAVFAAIAQNLVPALGQLWAAVTRLWNALNPGLIEVLKVVGVIVGAVLFAAIWLLVSALNVAIQVFAGVVSAVSNVINWVSNLISWFGNLVGIVVNTVGVIITVIRNIVPAIADVGGLIISVLTTPFRTAYNQIVGLFRNLPHELSGVAASAASSISNSIKGDLRSLHIPGFATGTSYAPGGMAVVGENGPELVNLPQGAQVYSNQQSKQMLQGGGSSSVTNVLSGNFTFNNQESVDAFFQRLDKTQRLALMGMA